MVGIPSLITDHFFYSKDSIVFSRKKSSFLKKNVYCKININILLNFVFNQIFSYPFPNRNFSIIKFIGANGLKFQTFLSHEFFLFLLYHNFFYKLQKIKSFFWLQFRNLIILELHNCYNLRKMKHV